MGKKLYVGNLPYGVTDEQLNEFFAGCGTVESAKVIVDNFSGRSKGFGFVEMSTDEEAAGAVTTLDGKELGGRNVKVNEARPKTDNRDSRGPRPRQNRY